MQRRPGLNILLPHPSLPRRSSSLSLSSPYTLLLVCLGKWPAYLSYLTIPACPVVPYRVERRCAAPGSIYSPSVHRMRLKFYSGRRHLAHISEADRRLSRSSHASREQGAAYLSLAVQATRSAGGRVAGGSRQLESEIFHGTSRCHRFVPFSLSFF